MSVLFGSLNFVFQALHFRLELESLFIRFDLLSMSLFADLFCSQHGLLESTNCIWLRELCGGRDRIQETLDQMLDVEQSHLNAGLISVLFKKCVTVFDDTLSSEYKALS